MRSQLDEEAIMLRHGFWVGAGLFVVGCLASQMARSQPAKAKTVPKLEPIAETKLLMNGIADPNFKGLAQIFEEKPKDAEAWAFARGRALLVAETGNLLLMRPAKALDAQDKWMADASELRDAATTLAKMAAVRDYAGCRTALAGVANICNRCHRDFRIPTRVRPVPDGE